MFTLGVPEMAVIFILALVLFGPKKLPELGRTIGKAMTEFRRASADLKATFDREMQSLEQDSLSVHQVTRQVSDEIRSSVEKALEPATKPWNPLDPESSNNQDSVGASAVSGAESQATHSPAPVSESTPDTAVAPVHSGTPAGTPSGTLSGTPAGTPEGTVARGSVATVEPPAEVAAVAEAEPKSAQENG